MRSYRHLWLLILSTLLFACGAERDYVPRVPEGDAKRGRETLARHECGVCHVIPGVANAVGKVGPALDHYSRRPYIAGKFPNEPDTLVRWIVDAPAMAELTAMPAIALSEQEARDMAAYLYESD
jgi:cytochrome c